MNQMEFVIFLTYKCNFRCDMCFQDEKIKASNIRQLELDEWEILFDSLIKKIEHPILIFMGGEPLLHKDFDKIIKKAYSKGIWSNIITNGYFLDEHLDTLIETDSGITISLHGMEKTHNSIVHNEQSFSKIITVLEKIQKYNKKRRQKLYCRINCVVQPKNIAEIEEFTKFTQKFNVSEVYLNHPNYAQVLTEQSTRKILSNLHCNHEKSNQLQLLTDIMPPEQKEKYVQKVNKFFNKLKTEHKYKNVREYPNFSEKERLMFYNEEEFSQIRPKRICASPWNAPYILPNGDIKNCQHNFIGNFLDKDFWDIWQGDENKKLQNYLKDNYCLPICRRCCCFYDNNYIYAKNNILPLKNGQKLLLDREMTMVPSSENGYFIWDIDRNNTNGNIPAIAKTFKNEKDKKRIQNCEKILGNFSDID